MSTLFFYGTLRHIPLLEIVLGRSFDENAVQAGVAEGYAVHAVKDADFPVIVLGGQGAKGFVISDLTDLEVERLNFYEGGFDYALTPIEIKTKDGPVTANVYFPEPDRLQAEGLWDFEGWVKQWSELTCLAAQEAMSYFGEKTHAELDFMFPSIRVRAASRLNAQKENHALSPSGFTREDVASATMTRKHAGFFTLEEHTLTHRSYRGHTVENVTREVFVGGDAALLLPYDTERDRVLLVEQFRSGPWARNDQTPWMLEPIAGRIDPGETPETAARREAFEEANVSVSELHSIAKVYASPGCNTEFFHIFVGEADLPDDITGVAGLDSEAEDIKSYFFGFDQLMEMVDKYQAANAPLVLAALWLARHRDRLRAST